MNDTAAVRSSQNESTPCVYCGLPVSGMVIDGEDAYCCFGCRFAAAVTGSRGDEGERRWMATALGLSVFCTMNVVMMTMALWSYASSPDSPFLAGLADFLRYAALLFTAPVLLLLGHPLGANAVGQLRRGVLSTDLLLLTGVVAAYLFSVVSTVRSHGHVYYEVSCVILVLVTLGRWLEATGRVQATAALDELERLIPEQLRCVTSSGENMFVLRDSVAIGDIVRVLPGERIPVDGRVTHGRGVVDEQIFTGESVPLEKRIDDQVLGGSLNLDGDLRIEVRASVASGALARLVEAVRLARLRKGRFQILADRWSQWFFPVIASIAFATFLLHGLRTGWETGLLTSMSVVLIACPCALALATPLAVWAALSSAARRGVLFRSGEALERLATIHAIRWDKTGTLTTGSPAVIALLTENNNDRRCVERVTATIVSGSTHVYSTAIGKFLRESICDDTLDLATQGSEVETVAGRGLILRDAKLGTIILGSESFLGENGLHVGSLLSSALQRQDVVEAAIVLIGWQELVRGVYLLGEELRSEATEAVNQCQRLSLNTAVLTGDRRVRAERLQAALDVPVLPELLPEQKLEAIRAAEQQFGGVAMVGDGLNDAPALAAASVGIAMGCGADVSRDSAGVCLLPDDLLLVPWAIQHSRRTVKTIQQNLVWSFGYNALGVVVAVCGLLHPAVAAVLMVASSLFVLGNSLRLNANDGHHEHAESTLDELAAAPAANRLVKGAAV